MALSIKAVHVKVALERWHGFCRVFGIRICNTERKMVINLEQYRISKIRKAVATARYDEELLCVNWNPAVSALALSIYQTPHEFSPELPRDNEKIDREFLDRARAIATQI